MHKIAVAALRAPLTGMLRSRYSYAITLPTEITAAALVIKFWKGGEDLNPAIFISVSETAAERSSRERSIDLALPGQIFLVVIVSFNFLGVRAYGEGMTPTLRAELTRS